MLTLVAVVASTFALSACGGKSGSSTSSPAGTTTTKHGHQSKPTY
jgi:hypothetical protein